MSETMLFDSARHEPLGENAWDPARAGAAIQAIVDDLEGALGPDGAWPWHPLDASGSEPAHKSIYMGAAGALWAMWYLEREGAARLRIKPAELIERTYGSYLDRPDTGEIVPSYFLGEVGILLVTWRLAQSAKTADRLWSAIEENIPNPINEALWAAPGTMVGALHMLEWTGERRWEELFLENVEQLWRTWLPSKNAPCHIWTQDLYGEVVQLLGAGHGFAGNAYPLLRGAALLSPERRETLYDRCTETVCATAMVDKDRANWPPSIGKPRDGRTKMLIQWCHGAPGIVTGLAHFPAGRSPAMDDMLVMAGNATWHAGPLAKGHGLCHGTAGNGYAFLELHRRTGDPIWLERARAFAMHALVQGEAMRRKYGQGRYSLWTGDPGVAIYLWHCVKGAGSMPGLDVL